MVTGDNKYAKRRLRSSYLSTVVSIALVLFMLGLLGTIVLYAKKLSDYVKENIELSIILNEKSKEADIVQFQKTLDAKGYIRSTEYITKEEAAERLTEELGEDFVSFLGYNPLLGSIDVRLVADYANSDSLANIEKQLSTNPVVQEIFYQKSLVDVINDNLKTISLIILGFSGLLFIIAIALINNTIRLSMYSRRFLIKSMQLVGATKGFIRRPFVWRGILNGFYGALIALVLLSGVLYMAQREIPELIQLQDLQMVGTLFIGVIILGMFLSYISTQMAVRRYLRSKLDDLYY